MTKERRRSRPIPDDANPPDGYEMAKPIQSRVGVKAVRRTGYDVVKWPEFLAFCKRLGVDIDLPFTSLNISMTVDGPVKITQTYLGDNISQKDAVYFTEEPFVENTSEGDS